MAITKKSDSTTKVNTTRMGLTFASSNPTGTDAFPIVYSDDVWIVVSGSTDTSQMLSGATGSYSDTEIINEVAKQINLINAEISDITGGSSGSISAQIQAAINALDANISGISNNIKVQVVEQNGKINGVTVTAPNFVGTSSDEASADTIHGAKAYTDQEIAKITGGGSGSISTQIQNAINALDSTKSGNSNGVSVEVVETDGLLSTVTVTAPDFANTYDAKGAADTVKGSSSDASSAITVYGTRALAQQALDQVNNIGTITTQQINVLFS